MNLLTDKQVAASLNISRSHVWRLAKQGNLPAPIRIGGRTTRWNESDLNAWLLTHKQERANDTQ